MKIDIIIDKLTNCLNERISGKVVNTNYKKRNSKVSRTETKNWKFDWTIADKDDYDVYELFVDGMKLGDILRIYTIDGTLVKTQVVESEITRIDISNLAIGSYLIQSKGNVVKFIKE